MSSQTISRITEVKKSRKRPKHFAKAQQRTRWCLCLVRPHGLLDRPRIWAARSDPVRAWYRNTSKIIDLYYSRQAGSKILRSSESVSKPGRDWLLWTPYFRASGHPWKVGFPFTAFQTISPRHCTLPSRTGRSITCFISRQVSY